MKRYFQFTLFILSEAHIFVNYFFKNKTVEEDN